MVLHSNQNQKTKIMKSLSTDPAMAWLEIRMKERERRELYDK